MVEIERKFSVKSTTFLEYTKVFTRQTSASPKPYTSYFISFYL